MLNTAAPKAPLCCKKNQWRRSSPTLKLLQIHSLNISSCQILHMSKERIGIMLSLRWEPRNEVLEIRVGP